MDFAPLAFALRCVHEQRRGSPDGALMESERHNYYGCYRITALGQSLRVRATNESISTAGRSCRQSPAHLIMKFILGGKVPGAAVPSVSVHCSFCCPLFHLNCASRSRCITSRCGCQGGWEAEGTQPSHWLPTVPSRTRRKRRRGGKEKRARARTHAMARARAHTRAADKNKRKMEEGEVGARATELR